ncbi:hypothetical protein FF1_014182 [Malus domestica]
MGMPMTKPYITFQGARKDATVIEWHDHAIDPGSNGQQLRTYQNTFHDVAAWLSEQEAKRLKEQDGVLAIFPETKYELHTTRSP